MKEWMKEPYNNKFNFDDFKEYTLANLKGRHCKAGDENKQEEVGYDNHYWNVDLWTIGFLDCIKVGIDDYDPQEDPFKYCIKDIVHSVMRKIETVEALKEVKDEADCLFIPEVARGLDILMANTVKKWKTIYCYDNIDYGDILTGYFKNDDVRFIKSLSHSITEEDVPEKCIMIFNTPKGHHLLFKDYKNIVLGIVEGGITKWEEKN